jgi:uncharacterized protein (DUF2236 family)
MTAVIEHQTRRRPIGPGSRMWEEIGLVTFPLTAGSAFLLQVMEPSIDAVVDEYSVFRTDALGRARRSIAAVQTWVYGGQEAIAEADRLRRMHATLNTTDAHGVRHTALASRPWAWVLLTGVNSYVTGADLFSKRPMTEDEKEAYYQEHVQIMRNFGVAEKEIPADYTAYLAHFDDTIRNHLRDTRVARDFLHGQKFPPPPPELPGFLAPLWRLATLVPGHVQYFVVVGTTPPPVRERLGLRWNPAAEVGLRALGRVVAHTMPLLPERLRYFPIAYRARRAERANQALRKVLADRPV